MKNKVLDLLRAEQGYISGQEMSRRLGVSRAAVWKAVEALRKEGYGIDSAPNRGYRLEALTDALSAREILPHLEDCPWGSRVQVLETIDSTNNRCKLLAAQGAPEGTVLVADCQTGGRGRLGRSFLSPPHQGVYLSVILRPQVFPRDLMHLTCAVAEAMCDAVERAAGFRPGIKWTNDLVSGQKKLAGILTELSVEAESGRVSSVVAGIGINCNQEAQDFPSEIREIATSLRQILGAPIDRSQLAAAMIRNLHRMDGAWKTGKAEWMARYAADCMTIGKDIQVVRGDAIRRAHADGIDADAALLVTYEDGTKEAVSSGEVSVRGMYGYV